MDKEIQYRDIDNDISLFSVGDSTYNIRVVKTGSARTYGRTMHQTNRFRRRCFSHGRWASFALRFPFWQSFTVLFEGYVISSHVRPLLRLWFTSCTEGQVADFFRMAGRAKPAPFLNSPECLGPRHLRASCTRASACSRVCDAQTEKT